MTDSVNSVSSPASVAGPLAVPPVAQAGDSLAEVATPSLLLDLDAFDANVARMASAASARGVAVRPHAKAHKSVTIARAQVAAGAVGVCCQKLTEAIPFVNAGIGSIHISNEFVGQARVALAVAMAARVSLSVCVDDVRQVAPLGKAAQRAGVRIAVLPEVDVGQGRCGVDSTEALGRLVDAIDHYEGRFAMEDTRMAVIEARRAGICVFAVTVDRVSRSYIPHLFGRNGHAVVSRLAAPAATASIWRAGRKRMTLP